MGHRYAVPRRLYFPLLFTPIHTCPFYDLRAKTMMKARAATSTRHEEQPLLPSHAFLGRKIPRRFSRFRANYFIRLSKHDITILRAAIYCLERGAAYYIYSSLAPN